MRKLLLATASAALMTMPALAEVKVGMITTLSGGGAGLGIDVVTAGLLDCEHEAIPDINA
ncbi:MAG: ABC transporter substrate-binding protein, partial [Pseudomonadota bacterium]